MAIHTVKHACTFIMGCSLLSLGGCAQLQNLGQSMWSGTKYVSNVSTHKALSLLRPAPKQIERFETNAVPTQTSDPLVADFMRRYAVPIVEHTPTFVAMNHTRENGVHMYRPGAQNTSNYIQITPRTSTPIYQASQNRAATTPLRPSSSPKFRTQKPERLAGGLPSMPTATTASYVKTSGGANMADWQNCQANAGDIYIAAGNSYSINPAFDTCMRSKGYLLEGEAVRALELAGG